MEILTCRRILFFMVFTGFILHQMLRVNIAIAIVDMIRPNSTNNSDHFAWSESQKATIIGAYFWGQVISLPGGRLSEQFGSRIIVGLAFLAASILTIITPFLASLHYYALVFSRLGVGLLLGTVSPGVFPLAVRWVPPTDMSKFFSLTRSVYLGGFLTLLSCGYLIDHFGWRSVFYVTGAISLVWSLSWFCLVYDSPIKHPRISRKEKEDILANVTACGRKRPTNTPWRKIATSGPVWAMFVASLSFILSYNIAESYLPVYMEEVFHLRPKTNGLICSLPYLASFVVVLASSYLADKWVKTKKFETLTIRKIFLFVTLGGPALVFTFLIFLGDNTVFSVIGFTICFACWGCSTPSVAANAIDIVPSYSGTVSGITFSFTSIACYLESMFIAYVTQDEQNFKQWKYVFGLLIATSLFGIIYFFLFGSSELQGFNLEGKEEYSGKFMKEMEDAKLSEK